MQLLKKPTPLEWKVIVYWRLRRRRRVNVGMFKEICTILYHPHMNVSHYSKASKPPASPVHTTPQLLFTYYHLYFIGLDTRNYQPYLLYPYIKNIKKRGIYLAHLLHSKNPFPKKSSERTALIMPHFRWV
jgi:hypothetical protein